MPSNEQTKEICIRCGHMCCREILVDSELKHSNKRYIEFYEKRGCTVYKMGDGLLTISIPYTCPNLIEGEGCGIQATKPKICFEVSNEWEEDNCELYQMEQKK